MLNSVAYEMAQMHTHHSEALSYSQRSLKEIEAKLQKIDTANILKEDLLPRLAFEKLHYDERLALPPVNLVDGAYVGVV